MYKLERRTEFNTVKDLRELLKDLPDDTKVLICGDSYAWFHIEEDDSVVCLDNEDLEESYLGD